MTERRSAIRAFVVISIVLLLVSAVCMLIVYYAFGGWSERAAFGDMFGVVNALLSSMALAGVIVTIILQGQELRLQREVLQRSARLTSLSILIPILQKRVAEAPATVRDSEGYRKLVARVDQLEEELNAWPSLPTGNPGSGKS